MTLKPQTRYFTDPPTETNEAAIETFWNGQLYTVIGKPDAAGALAAAAVVEAVRDPDLARRRADRAGRRAGAWSGACGAGARREPTGAGSATHEPRRPLRAAGAARRCSSRRWSGGWRTPADTTIRSRLDGPAGAGVRAARRACRRSRACRRPIWRPASRAWSTSSPAGACRASPRCRCSQQLKARGVAIDGIAVRDRPEDLADFLARNGDPYERIGSRRRKPGADRARLVGRAGKLRRRWPGRHPLPAYRPDRGRRHAD